MTRDLVKSLLARLFDSNGKGSLETLLRRVKNEKQLRKNDLRTTGSAEALEGIVIQAVADKILSLAELRELVDRSEEYGAQHVFLFSLKPSFRPAVSRLAHAFPQLPHTPTDALYAQLPTQNKIYCKDSDGELTLKQVRAAHYWIKDTDASTETEDKQVLVRIRKQRRAVNVVRIDKSSGEVEVRISKVTGEPINQKHLALELLDDLEARCAPHFSFAEHCQTVPIWRGFTSLVKNRRDIFMAIDAARDATYKRALASRREGKAGKDVRDAPGYEMDDARYARDSLSVYWKLPGTEDDWLHTQMAKIVHAHSTNEWHLAKVYISAKATPEEVRHVITRIRSAAS